MTKELNIDFNSENKELNLANLEKLELVTHLCEAKLEKGISLPFDKIEITGFNYVKLIRPDLSRKVEVSFIVWESQKQSAKDFSRFYVVLGRKLG